MYFENRWSRKWFNLSRISLKVTGEGNLKRFFDILHIWQWRWWQHILMRTSTVLYVWSSNFWYLHCLIHSNSYLKSRNTDILHIWQWRWQCTLMRTVIYVWSSNFWYLHCLIHSIVIVTRRVETLTQLANDVSWITKLS